MSGGAFPIAAGTYARPKAVEFRGFSPARISTAHSLKRNVRSRGAHRWYLRLSYDPMYPAEWNPIVAFCDEQYGPVGKFTIVIPGKETPRGAVAGAPQVNGNQAAGVTTVNLKNLAVDTANIFRAGDLITFVSHLKVYEVTRDAASDAGGLATVYINSPLMTAIVNTSAVAFANVTMQCSLITDDVRRQWKGGLVCPGFDIEIIEDPF